MSETVNIYQLVVQDKDSGELLLQRLFESDDDAVDVLQTYASETNMRFNKKTLSYSNNENIAFIQTLELVKRQER